MGAVCERLPREVSECVSTRLCSQYAGGTLGYSTAYYLHSTLGVQSVQYHLQHQHMGYNTTYYLPKSTSCIEDVCIHATTPQSVQHKFWNVCRMVSRLQHNSFPYSDLKLTPLLSTQCTRWSVGWRTKTIKFCRTNFFQPVSRMDSRLPNYSIL